MWLLNTTTLQLRSFVIDIPDYAILSHTWGAEEVTFGDIGKPHAPSMAGYGKLVGCCQLAVKDGLDWAWIDTCCIDKKSSAELSEAINSMYQWYWNAAICYAYLTDVSTASPTWRQDVEVSRWFKRGWTLQELLAPEALEFYDSKWQPLGTKSKLISRIQKATKIQPKFLLNRKTIKNASVATKFSWAADRETTRAEDMAYCLLGLVEVNMPMLYGEGDRAFYRLQLEILRQTNEHSIFAWESPGMARSMTSVLAHSPVCFKDSATIHPTTSRKLAETVAHEVTNYGLRISLRCLAAGAQGDQVYALLGCEQEDSVNVGILLQILGPGRYGRVPGTQLVTFDQEEGKAAELLSMYLIVRSDSDEQPGSSAVRMILGSVLTDRPCSVQAVAVSNVRKLPKVNVWSGKDVNAYVIDSLSVGEDEAANMQLVFGSLSSDSYNIIFGLRGGQAMVHSIDDVRHRLFGQEHLKAIEQDWSTDMCLDPNGEWESRGDYEQILTQNESVVQLSARREVVNKEKVWALTVQIFRCLCGAVDASGEDCICDVHSKTRLHSECGAADASSADCVCHAYAVFSGQWHMIGGWHRRTVDKLWEVWR